jgi:hypothetical protein
MSFGCHGHATWWCSNVETSSRVAMTRCGSFIPSRQVLPDLCCFHARILGRRGRARAPPHKMSCMSETTNPQKLRHQQIVEACSLLEATPNMRPLVTAAVRIQFRAAVRALSNEIEAKRKAGEISFAFHVLPTSIESSHHAIGISWVLRHPLWLGGVAKLPSAVSEAIRITRRYFQADLDLEDRSNLLRAIATTAGCKYSEFIRSSSSDTGVAEILSATQSDPENCRPGLSLLASQIDLRALGCGRDHEAIDKLRQVVFRADWNLELSTLQPDICAANVALELVASAPKATRIKGGVSPAYAACAFLNVEPRAFSDGSLEYADGSSFPISREELDNIVQREYREYKMKRSW